MRVPSAAWIDTGKLLVLVSVVVLAMSACAQAPPAAAPADSSQSQKVAPIAQPVPTRPAAPEAKPAEAPDSSQAQKAAAPATKVDPRLVEEFYRGKTVRVIVATTAGSLYDAWARLLARHLPRHLPGNPSMVVENMPGAGHLIGANYVYNVAPKDGTVIGTFVETQVTNQLVGGKGVEFDAAKFNWLGALSPANIACLVRTDVGNKVTDLNQMLGPTGKEVVFGSTGPGTSSHDYPLLMKQLLGANIKFVSGYPGNQEVRAAIEKGEAEAYCATWEAIDRGLEPWKEAGHPPYQIVVQEGAEREPAIQDVPVMRDLAKTDDDKLMFRLLSGVANFSRPYTAPPGVPAERVEALRQAFLDALKSPELLAEAQKAKLEFNPRSGAQVQAGFQAVLDTPRDSIERFTKLMATQP